MSRRRVLCKFFARGDCWMGEVCPYSHEWKDLSSSICTYYQEGNCSYGHECRYHHVIASNPQSAASPSTTIPSGNASFPPYAATTVHGLPSELSPVSRPILPSNHQAWHLESDRPLCSFAVSGNCLRGDQCPYIHGDLCPGCGKYCLHPSRPEEIEEHTRTCEDMQKHLDALKRSQEIECGVCLDKVLSKPVIKDRKFGVLAKCDHPFCFRCIKNWRRNSSTSGRRKCPVCRKLSYYVVPSEIWYFSQEEKTKIIDNYKAKLRSIDCDYFNFGDGRCPFGKNCFYKHCVKPGSYVWKHHRPPPRRPCPRNSSVVEDSDDDDYDDDDDYYDDDDLWDEEILDYDDFCDPYNLEYLDDEDFHFMDDDEDEVSPFEMALLLADLNSGTPDYSCSSEE